MANEFQHHWMAARDPRIDAYIAKAAPFASPVRKLVHQGCPAVGETMKWSMPHFEHRGIMLGMAAFKVRLIVWCDLTGDAKNCKTKIGNDI